MTSRSVSMNSWLYSLAGVLCVFVLTARCWLPAEGASNGETLWLVLVAALGLLLAVVTPCQKNGTTSPHRLWGVLLLGGFGLIALACLLTTLSGLVPLERRRALNITGEWLGVWVWLALLLLLCQQGLQRAVLLRTLLSVAGVLAVLGCWQHFVELPRLSQEFAPALAALKEGRPVPAELQQSLAAAGVSNDPESIARFEARLIFSREPIGFFALANSLAGLLLAALLWGGRCWLSQFHSTRRLQSNTVYTSNTVALANRGKPTANRSQFLTAPEGWSVVMLGVTGLCLLLTKSRTAVLALVLVVGASGLIRLLSARQAGLVGASANRAQWVWGGGLVVVIGAVIAALSAAGSLDLPIVTQAVRSFSYRAEYWRATFELLRSGAWSLGVGPGAFQDAYVQFKLPGASEEVADPHNLWLEAWTTGGLIAAVGSALLLGMSLVLAWRACWKWETSDVGAGETGPRDTGTGDVETGRRVTAGWGWGVWLSPWGVLLFDTLAGRGWDDRLVLVGVALPLVYWSLSSMSLVSTDVIRQGAGLAAMGLTLHFQGAGGFGMPVLMMCWGMTLAAAVPQLEWTLRETGNRFTARLRGWRRWGGVTLSLVTCLFISRECLLPSSAAARLVASGDRWLGTGRLELARRDYLAAFDADPADSVPAIRLMELEAQVVLNLVKSSAFLPTISPGGDNVNSPEWTAFRASAKEALVRRPGSFRLEWRWGEVATADAQRGDHRLWEEAMLHLDEARYLYPTNTRVLADLAVAQRAVGRMAEARGVARTAIQLDDLNRQRGHTDRWLTEEVRKSLEQFSNEAR